MTSIKTAHYFASKTRKVVFISETMAPVGKEVEVSGKAEARKVAEQHNAKPWNF
jgi:hypothetical protein